MVGLFALVLHPTVASAFGPVASKIFGGLAIAMLLPACRRVAIAPSAAILAACAFIGTYAKSVDATLVAIPACAIFHLAAYDNRRFYRTVLTIGIIAAVMALLQFAIPSPWLNIHATAESLNRFLDQYRPTSIFPSQAYYNQLLLLSIPLFLLAKETRGWFLIFTGFSAAVTGATAGLMLVGLALFLGLRRGALVLAGFGAAIGVMMAFYRDRLLYNFSMRDQYESVASRIQGAPTEPKDAIGPIVVPIIVTDHPSLIIAVQCIALAGVLLVVMVAIRQAIPIGRLFPLLASVLAIFAGQMIHPTMGSLYFALTLAVLALLLWELVRLSIEHTAMKK